MAKKMIIGFAENGVGKETFKACDCFEFARETGIQLANMAPLASGANAATIVTKVNALIAAMKATGLMFRDWTIANTLGHITSNNSATAIANEAEYQETLTAAAGYALPDSVTVKINGTVITTGYTWVKATGVLTVASVTGDLAIIADGVKVETVTQTLTGCTSSSDATSIVNGETFTATYTASDTYTLPDSITVTMGGETLTEGYTWTKATGALSVPNVTGALVVTITATAAAAE